MGHDVDLLIERGCRNQALALLKASVESNGWQVLRVAEFGPLAVFIIDPTKQQCIHIDLFDRIEWHWIEYGDTDAILSRRKWNGRIYHPSHGDEIFLNICTRLIYRGLIRNKHKAQVARWYAEDKLSNLAATFKCHLGRSFGTKLAESIINGDWNEIEQCKVRLRLNALIHWGIFHPSRSIYGIIRYLGRATRRILTPPGPFVILTGSDEDGKLIILEKVVPLLESFTGLNNTLLFHWKPSSSSIDANINSYGETQCTESLPVRSSMLSLLFLGYHWIGFWYGWFSCIYPALIHSRPVIGDRYAFDMYLNPRRYRLNLPGWLLKAAAFSVPRPHLLFILTKNQSELLHSVPKLPSYEIKIFQKRLNLLSKNYSNSVLIDLSQPEDIVSQNIRNSIIENLLESGART